MNATGSHRRACRVRRACDFAQLSECNPKSLLPSRSAPPKSANSTETGSEEAQYASAPTQMSHRGEVDDGTTWEERVALRWGPAVWEVWAILRSLFRYADWCSGGGSGADLSLAKVVCGRRHPRTRGGVITRAIVRACGLPFRASIITPFLSAPSPSPYTTNDFHLPFHTPHGCQVARVRPPNVLSRLLREPKRDPAPSEQNF